MCGVCGVGGGWGWCCCGVVVVDTKGQEKGKDRQGGRSKRGIS